MNTPRNYLNKKKLSSHQFSANGAIRYGIRATLIILMLTSHSPAFSNRFECPLFLGPLTVTWTPNLPFECSYISATNFEIETAGADVTFRATEQVRLGEGFSVSNYGQFRVIMVDSYQQFICGYSCH